MIMQAEKFHDLPPCTQKTQERSGMIQHQSGGLRTRRTNGMSCSLRAGASSTSPTKKGKFSCPPLFCAIQAINRLSNAHPHWKGSSALLSLLCQRLISSGNTLTDGPRNNVQPNIWLLHDPVKLTSAINHTPMHIHFYLASNMAMYFLSFTLPFSFPPSLTSPDFFATKTSQNIHSIKQDTKNIIKNKKNI